MLALGTLLTGAQQACTKCTRITQQSCKQLQPFYWQLGTLPVTGVQHALNAALRQLSCKQLQQRYCTAHQS